MADEGESASLSIMSSMLETTPTDRGELVIQQGELAGRRYSFEAVVCQDPTCDCEHVTLKCFTEMAEEGPTTPVYLEMDLERRQIANLEELKANPTTGALANAVAAECGQEEWDQLRRIYSGLKQYWTEHSDLEQVEVSFPPDAPTGAMVAYFDVFPFAKRIEFTRPILLQSEMPVPGSRSLVLSASRENGTGAPPADTVGLLPISGWRIHSARARR